LARPDFDVVLSTPLAPRTPPSALWTGVAASVAYGVAFRLLISHPGAAAFFGAMTIAFLFVVPFVIGFLTVHVGDRDGTWTWPHRLFLPWLSALLSLGVALLFAWEGLICVVLWVPLFLVMSLLGGLAAALAGKVVRGRRARAALAGCFALLPALVAPLEREVPVAGELRLVTTSIEIQAPPATVWSEIARVRRFEAVEHRFAWSHLIGFPRPVEATLSFEGEGGIRHASFERGVVFVETIRVWEPGRRLAFAIDADPDSIPARALDEHVTVGGPYFDVLEGEYEIEPLAADRVRLHLASRHRLSTRFNFYAGAWTDFILADTQRYILEALKRRCEAEG
jgi:hypothetical protein